MFPYPQPPPNHSEENHGARMRLLQEQEEFSAALQALFPDQLEPIVTSEPSPQVSQLDQGLSTFPSPPSFIIPPDGSCPAHQHLTVPQQYEAGNPLMPFQFDFHGGAASLSLNEHLDLASLLSSAGLTPAGSNAQISDVQAHEGASNSNLTDLPQIEGPRIGSQITLDPIPPGLTTSFMTISAPSVPISVLATPFSGQQAGSHQLPGVSGMPAATVLSQIALQLPQDLSLIPDLPQELKMHLIRHFLQRTRQFSLVIHVERFLQYVMVNYLI